MTNFISFLLVILAILAVNVSQINGFLEDSNNETTKKSNLTLEQRLEIERTTFHWYPYKRIVVQELDDGSLTDDCWERPRAIEEFPKGWWTRQERLRGRFLLHIFVAVYFFIILAFICDKYFLPTVERICVVLNISQDVAASTFMATATTTPEFFANTISTFVADSDMGLSAIIGSMMFNTLGVAALASLFTRKPIQIDWWPVTRDSLMFSLNISVLVAFAWDGIIMWYETIVLVTMYVLYWILMFQNPRIMKFVKNIIEDRLMWCQRIKNYDIANQRPYEVKPTTENGSVENGNIPTSSNGHISGNRESYRGYDNYGLGNSIPTISAIESAKDQDRRLSNSGSLGSEMNNDRRQSKLSNYELAKARARRQSSYDSIRAAKQRSRRQSTDLAVAYDGSEDEEEFGLWEIPRGVWKFDIFWFFFTWPIRFILHYTIPNPAKFPRLFALSFFMCIIWIGVVSYMIFWMVVILGDVFNIPEAVMGLTFLGFGGCMPEAIAAVIVARQGSGQFGVSNALGANSLAVLFSLGVPWFIRTMATGIIDGFGGAKIRIFTHGIEFTIMMLLLAVAILYVSLCVAGYKLRKKVGGVLGIGYIFIATFAILVELDVFFEASDIC